MNFFSTLFLSLFLSATYADSFLVDPDSLDPSMPSVDYLISSKNLAISKYHLNVPSLLKVKLCKKCLEKKYKLDNSAELRFEGKPLDKKELTETILKNTFSHLRLRVNRKKNMITYLYLGENPEKEFIPTLSSAKE